MKNNYDDLKIVDCGNGNMILAMKKETWQTIVQIIDWARDVYRAKRKEAELD